MTDLFAAAASADFEDRAIEPARELGAYEALWARDGTTFKKLADLFRCRDSNGIALHEAADGG